MVCRGMMKHILPAVFFVIAVLSCHAQGPRPVDIGASRQATGAPGVAWYTTWDTALAEAKPAADFLRETAEKISGRPIGELLIWLSETRKEHDAAKRQMDKARKDLEMAMKA